MNIIKQAAILHNGIIYEGKRHKDIVMNAPKHINIRKGGVEGFVTNTGMFLNRKEAANVAYMMGQIKNPVSELKSEHLY